MKRILYDYVDESSIDEELKCSICKEPFQQPVNTPCDHTFCQLCIEQWINKNYDSCPTCRQFISKDLLKSTTRIVINLLDRLKIQCKICGEKSIQRSIYIDHITKICPNSIISCLASDILCTWKGPRYLFQNHYDNCSYEKLRSVLNNLIQTNNKLKENEKNLQTQIEQFKEKILEKDKQILKLQSNEYLYKEQNQILTQQLKEACLIVESIIQTITFDILDTSSKLSCDKIPDNYAGYKWINGWYITKHHATINHPNTSWLTAFNHRDNHTCIAYNKNGENFILKKFQQGQKFSINSLEIIPIHHTLMELILIARRAKQQIYNRIIKLSGLITHIIDLNWENIDEFEIKSNGIISIPKYKHSVAHFALISLQLTDKEFFNTQNIINSI